MYGAVIGDLAGSIYEYQEVKKVSSIYCQNIIETNSFISDDTILTIAVLDAILSNKDYEVSLKEYGLNYLTYRPKFTPYFKTTFSPNFIKWLQGTTQGISTGNGAMMRISPIGYLFNNEKDVISNAHLATTPSHNSKEAIESATKVALIIYYARKGLTKEKIIKKLHLNLKTYPLTKFNTTCNETIDICLYTVFNSTSFEESIRNILLYGGDTDTNACIVGSMAEALYGIDSSLIEQANKYLPEEFEHKLTLAYKKIGDSHE